MTIPLASVPTLVKTINALIVKGDHASDKAEQFYKAAGIHLAECKARKPNGIPWPAFVAKNFTFGRSRADELIMIGDGRATVAKLRTDTAARVAKHATVNRQARAAVTNGGKASSAGHPAELAPPTDKRTVLISKIMRLVNAMQEDALVVMLKYAKEIKRRQKRTTALMTKPPVPKAQPVVRKSGKNTQPRKAKEPAENFL